MGYREATTHIQLWLLGAVVSHLVFDVVDFMICEIEDIILDSMLVVSYPMLTISAISLRS
jgi:hypothetical protein